MKACRDLLTLIRKKLTKTNGTILSLKYHLEFSRKLRMIWISEVFVKIAAKITDNSRKCILNSFCFHSDLYCTVHSTLNYATHVSFWSKYCIIIGPTLIYWEVLYKRSIASPGNI